MARVAKLGSVCSYPRGALIQTEGEPGETMGLVLSGQLKVFVGDVPRHRVQLQIIGPGDYIGLTALVGIPRGVSVRALTPARVCLLNRATIENLIAMDREFASHLMHCLVGRIRALTTTVHALVSQNVGERVTALLRELARAEGDSRVVRPQPRQRDIAERVGASPAMVSKVMKELVGTGIVTLRPGAIVVHPNPAALRDD